MPTYDYVCDACGHAWEEFQSMSAKHIQICPECNKKKARRLIGMGAGLIFKGSGFYSTDYRKPGSSGGREESGAAAGSGEGKGASGGDSASTSAGSEQPSGNKLASDSGKSANTSATSQDKGNKSTKPESAPSKTSSNDKKS